MTCSKPLAGIGAAIALASCVVATPGVVDTVSAKYVTGGGTWNTGGGITVAATVIDHLGKAAVCGVWTTDQQSALTIDLNDQVMQAGSVDIAGDRLVQNLAFMSTSPYSDNIAGVTANCYVTDTPWKPAYDTDKPKIMLPVMAFSEIDPPKADRVIFRPGPRPPVVH